MRFRHQASLVRAQEGRAHSRGLHHGSRTTASRGCYVGETGQSKQAQGESKPPRRGRAGGYPGQRHLAGPWRIRPHLQGGRSVGNGRSRYSCRVG